MLVVQIYLEQVLKLTGLATIFIMNMIMVCSALGSDWARLGKHPITCMISGVQAGG